MAFVKIGFQVGTAGDEQRHPAIVLQVAELAGGSGVNKVQKAQIIGAGERHQAGIGMTAVVGSKARRASGCFRSSLNTCRMPSLDSILSRTLVDGNSSFHCGPLPISGSSFSNLK